MSAYTNNSSTRIARPSSMVLTSPIHLTAKNYRSKLTDYKKKQQIKRPTSRLSKSHSMHRLDLESDEDEDDNINYNYLLMENQKSNQSEMKRRTLLSRATTTPYVPKPSSLIKRFSDHSNSGVLTSTKMSNNNNNSNTTEMRRSASLMSPQQEKHHQIDYTGGGLVSVTQYNFRLGQRVTVPSLSIVGTIRFFGETQFKDKGSIWVGIELDIKGSGKNDGSVHGVRYFSCPPNTGIFVLASKVIALEEYSHFRKITPRISKTTTSAATAKKSNSSTTETIKRKSMIITTSQPHNTISSSSSRTTTTPKKNRSMTTNSNNIKPSKSARTISSTISSSTRPLPTRSSPFETKKPTTKTSKPPMKKSSSLSSSTVFSHDTCQHHRSTPPKRSTRANTLPNKHPADEELKRIQTLLEQSREEQRALAQQMDGKEAAWEKLVSVKESYAIRVQEKDNEIMRLKRLLEQSQPSHDQLVKITGERDAALSRASMSEAMEKQHSKVISRLDTRVHDLQHKLDEQTLQHTAQIRDHVAQMEQLRKQLTEREQAVATIERECGELRKTHMETVRAFERSMHQLQQQHESEQMQKDAHIARLEQTVHDFQQIYPTTPITPTMDDDENSPRRRLEAQLELTTQELDRERQVIKTQALDIEQLKNEIKRLHRASVCSSSQFYSLRTELETEIEDKRRIMEEANAAIESQALMEDENERLKLTLEKTQHDLADVLKKLAKQPPDDLASTCRSLEMENERLQTLQRQTEHECLRLMDELLAIEKAAQQDESAPVYEYRRQIEQLTLQVAREAKRYQDLERANQAKIDKLTKEVADLESLVENKVFNETELEEAIECEKRKVRMLELRLQDKPLSPPYQKRSRHNTVLGSDYCEICEEYGHDVMTCNAYNKSMYCVNCDVFDTHPTEECPNQDETF